MIIVKLKGGLGNQMFQYSFGKVLEFELNEQVGYDTSFYNKSSIDFSLKRMNIKGKFQNFHFGYYLSKIFENYELRSYYNNYFRKLLIFYPMLYMDHKNFNMDEIKESDLVYLNGYWQKFNLIEKYHDTFSLDFNIKDALNLYNERKINQIRETESVSIHYRRGDYVSNPYYVECSFSYYREAIDYIKKKVSNPHFFIFSNDMNWVKKFFDISESYSFIDNPGPDYEHLHLMRECKHNIIANSTFSWWAAWLNTNFDKIVIGPELWWNDLQRKKDIYFPPTWLRFQN